MNATAGARTRLLVKQKKKKTDKEPFFETNRAGLPLSLHDPGHVESSTAPGARRNGSAVLSASAEVASQITPEQGIQNRGVQLAHRPFMSADGPQSLLEAQVSAGTNDRGIKTLRASTTSRLTGSCPKIRWLAACHARPFIWPTGLHDNCNIESTVPFIHRQRDMRAQHSTERNQPETSDLAASRYAGNWTSGALPASNYLAYELSPCWTLTTHKVYQPAT
jgi:hypothetical protein